MTTTTPTPTLADLDKPEIEQEWAKVDPATAFHLIERHVEDWADAGRMMEAWRKANSSDLAPSPQIAEVAELPKQSCEIWRKEGKNGDIVIGPKPQGEGWAAWTIPGYAPYQGSWPNFTELDAQAIASQADVPVERSVLLKLTDLGRRYFSTLLSSDRDSQVAKLTSQVHYWMDRGDRAIMAREQADLENIELRAQVASAQQDASRFRWLNEDHDSAEVREQARALAERLGTSSYFAITRDIDSAIAATPAPASAGQTAPDSDLRDAAEALLEVLDGYHEQLVPINRKSVTVNWLRKALAAHPAEGAGQAGQVAMTADELAALRRFYECAADGEGYDVPKPMMRRLSEIGVVQRISGAYYHTTEYGLAVLDSTELASAPANQPSAQVKP